MIERTLFSEEHEIFRQSVRRFMEELAPHHAEWEEQGEVPRWAWKKAGEQGFLCAAIPEESGGVGADRRYSIILMEEQARLNLTGLGFALHSDIVAPYIDHYGTTEQKRRWLPKMTSGDYIAGIAMTEPGGGSDLQAIRTTAVRDGDEYVISGQKTFITNGQTADLFLVACKTDRSLGAKGISLIVVETDRPGFERGRRLKKLGTKAQDTSELYFNEVRVTADNLIGEEGKGFGYMMNELAWERMHVGIQAISCCEAALEWTIDYTRNRKAFGKPVIEFQNSRFKLAEMKTEVQVGPHLPRPLPRTRARRTSSIRQRRPWSSCGPARRRARFSTRCCSCTAGTASCGNIRSRAPSPTLGCSGSMPAPTRS